MQHAVMMKGVAVNNVVGSHRMCGALLMNVKKEVAKAPWRMVSRKVSPRPLRWTGSLAWAVALKERGAQDVVSRVDVIV
jgi:hypothetical protein